MTKDLINTKILVKLLFGVALGVFILHLFLMKSENEFINFANVLFNSSLSFRILFESLEMISNALDTHLFRWKPEQDKETGT